MKKRIVVIGGQGYLGRRAVDVLRRSSEFDVVVAGRSGPDLKIDLGDEASLAGLRGAAVVVNVSSTHLAPPDRLSAFCRAEGLVYVEASSDRVVVERLLAARAEGTSAPGLVVLGAGIYTGLSNLLGGAAARSCPGANSLTIGIRSSPFGGAGQGTIDLMVDALAVPARAARQGALVDEVAGVTGPVVPFPRRPRWSLKFSFPEVPMLLASTGIANVELGFSPAPSILWPSFRFLPTWLMTSRFFGFVMGLYFLVLRRGLFAGRATEVELYAGAKGSTTAVHKTLVAADGMAVGGAAIAAIATQLARTRPDRGGVVTVDEVLTLEATLAEMKRLAPEATVHAAT